LTENSVFQDQQLKVLQDQQHKI